MNGTKPQESERVEFKKSFAEKENAGKDLCSFANKKGGILYFGFKNNGQIVGLKNLTEKNIRNLSQLYFDNFDPQIIFEIEKKTKNNLDFVEIKVEKSKQPYHTYKGIPYIRIGSTTRKISKEEYSRRLIYYKSANKDYSSTLVSNTKLSDLSPEALKELRSLLIQSGRYTVNVNKLSDKQLLKDLLLLQDNQLTIASLILLGKKDSLYKFLPYSEIRYGYKVNESKITNQDMKIFKGGYLLNYKKIWDKINSRNISINIPYGMRLVDKKAFDEQTIREAVNNAIAHRDYLIKSSIFIIQYPSKINIKNPGGFPEGVTIDNILYESKPRNKLIADILFKCELVEQFGNGVNLMFKNQLSLGKYPPNYSGSDEKKVILELDGKIQDIEFAKYVLKVAEEKDKELSDEELIILNRINNQQKIKASQITQNLLDLGLIEKIGYGKYMLSKQYYSDINRKWEYTKRKGLPKSKNKELILQHLKDFGKARKKDFMGVFGHSLTEKQLEGLLEELKKEGKIFFDGLPRSRTAFWKLNKGTVGVQKQKIRVQ